MSLELSYLRLPPTIEGVGGQGGGEPDDPSRIAQAVFGTPDWRRRQPADRILNLGRNWQILHYLITGDPWDGRLPAADVVCGGRLLTEDGADKLGMDVIYLDPHRVKQAADHLATTPFQTGRFDVATMMEADVQDAGALTQSARDEVFKPAYHAVSDFYAAAAAEGQAIYKVMG
ncbi:DUF1877 domain-containing protein [Actinomadura craniellae]|uniref:DUF1877 domain-containing protein n=1 Tax=Actinomadura craniellae TaxID=2231787 RepID=A0A365H225_9ACTN|nr:DUF1877 family protein [Actinomadura craniellae]RAY13151.1 DUF1877 domain-containing protein [Actinomadura craniellae]